MASVVSLFSSLHMLQVCNAPLTHLLLLALMTKSRLIAPATTLRTFLSSIFFSPSNLVQIACEPLQFQKAYNSNRCLHRIYSLWINLCEPNLASWSAVLFPYYLVIDRNPSILTVYLPVIISKAFSHLLTSLDVTLCAFKALSATWMALYSVTSFSSEAYPKAISSGTLPRTHCIQLGAYTIYT